MTLPTTGALSINDIATEFGGSTPHSLSEYYAGGGLVPAGTTGTYGAVPSSGAITIQNFYGTSNYIAPTFTTGAEQTASVSGDAAIQIANGYIVTGAYLDAGGSQALHYKQLTVNNKTGVWGTQSSVGFAYCSNAYITLNPATPNIMSGRQISIDGTYTGWGTGYYKPFSITGAKSVSFGAVQSTTQVGSGTWTDVPSTSVTNASSLNIAVGYQYYIGGGSCARLTYNYIQHQVFYATVTIS